jgi:methyl-accepting chemotaxis protein
VLASSLKSLANPTAKITEEVGGQVGSVRSSAVGAVCDAAAAASTIDPIRDVTTMVDAATDEQDAAAGQISGNAPAASQGSAEVAENRSGAVTAPSSWGSADLFSASRPGQDAQARINGVSH